MNYAKFAVVLACVATPAAVWAGASDKAIKDNPGYKSGASDSGKSGMDSSRGVPTSPTSGRPGTVDNGDAGMKRGSAR